MSCSEASGDTSSTKACTEPSAIRTITLRRSAAAGIVSAVASAAPMRAAVRRILSVRLMVSAGETGAV